MFSAACMVSLAACDPRFVHGSGLRPSEVPGLAGVWEGRGALSFSDDNRCPRVYLVKMRVGDGNVAGEMIDDAKTGTTPASFTTFVEYDGSLHATLRVDGRETNILGSFGRDNFTGTARAPGCTYVVRLRRRDTAS
ncbi:MAG TPA: hypothetical protein VGB82_04825 [Alphaproteobacteria bacterium]